VLNSHNSQTLLHRLPFAPCDPKSDFAQWSAQWSGCAPDRDSRGAQGAGVRSRYGRPSGRRRRRDRDA